MSNGICLVRCPKGSRSIPAALICIRSYLKSKNLESSIIDINTPTYGVKSSRYSINQNDLALSLISSRVKKRVTDFDYEKAVMDIFSMNPTIIGFHVNDMNINNTLFLAKEIKKRDKNKIIVFGGPNCRRVKINDYLKKGIPVDFFVRGEGERTFYEIAIDAQKGKMKKKYRGALSFDGENLIDGGEPEPIDMNTLPYSYINGTNKIYVFGKKFPVQMSRGCQGNCAFCSDRLLWNGFRTKKGELTGREIEFLNSKYGISDFFFCDIALNNSPKEMESFCRYIIKKGIKIRWSAALTAKSLDYKTLDTMKKAGCKSIFLGIESGSQRVLDIMRKGTRVSEYQNILDSAHKLNIGVLTGIMVGFPGERLGDFLRTLRFIIKNRKKIISVSCNMCVLKSGTDIHDSPKLFGIKNNHRYLWTTTGYMNNIITRSLMFFVFVAIFRIFRL